MVDRGRERPYPGFSGRGCVHRSPPIEGRLTEESSITTLKVGIASYEAMKARTMAVARGERRIAADEPKVWFTSTESFEGPVGPQSRSAAGHRRQTVPSGGFGTIADFAKSLPIFPDNEILPTMILTAVSRPMRQDSPIPARW